MQLRDAEVLGRQDFRIIERDGSRDDDGVHTADVLRLLAAQRDLRAHLAQFLDDAGILAVRPRHLIAEFHHHLGQRAHAGAADAYEMNLLDAFQLFELFMHSNHLFPFTL